MKSTKKATATMRQPKKAGSALLMRKESIFHSHCEERAIIRDLLPNACLTYPSTANIDHNRGYRIATRCNQRCARMPFPDGYTVSCVQLK